MNVNSQFSNEKKQWIVVAHRASARIFFKESSKKIRLITELENPEGRLKNHEIDSDRPGRSFSSADSRRSATEPSTEATEQVSIVFSKKLAHYLDEARTQHRFDSLVIIAGPQFLGQIRQDLSTQTSACISQTIDKNLGGLNPEEISIHLQRLLEDEDRRMKTA